MMALCGFPGSTAKWIVPAIFSYPDMPMSARRAMSTRVTSARAGETQVATSAHATAAAQSHEARELSRPSASSIIIADVDGRLSSRASWLCAAAVAWALVATWVSPARAEVTRVDIARRADIGMSGYEKIAGTIHFAVDPGNPHNAIIVDLDKAPRNADGRVEFSADLYIMRPKDATRG